MKTCGRLVVVVLFATAFDAYAFVAHSALSTRNCPVQTALCATNSNDPKYTYKEESRKSRRTIFTHDDWVNFRSPGRFVRNIKSIVDSGVYRGVLKEVLLTATVATFICVFNAAVTGYTNWEGVHQTGPLEDTLIPLLSLPIAPFTLSSPALGLLLVFRTNACYVRWDEARKNWGMNINHTRDLIRMGSAYYDREGIPEHIIKKDLNRLALCTWAFVRAMKRHLSPEWEDEEAFKKELFEKLPKKQAEKIIAASHRPNRALQDLSTAIEALPMNFIRKNEVHAAATIFENNLGSSERLLSSPVPVFYSRHAARFTSLWLLMLPFALYGQCDNTWNHWGMIPATAAISLALFGIDELANQLEEPFTILPMQAYCDKIYNWCMEITSFEPNDNNMFTDSYISDVEALARATSKRASASAPAPAQQPRGTPTTYGRATPNPRTAPSDRELMQSILKAQRAEFENIAEEAKRVSVETELAAAELVAAQEAAAEMKQETERQFAEFQQRQAQMERRMADEWAAAEEQLAQEMAAVRAANGKRKTSTPPAISDKQTQVYIAAQKAEAENEIASQKAAAEQAIAAQVAAVEQALAAQNAALEKAAADRALAEQATAEATAMLQEAALKKAEAENMAERARQAAEKAFAEKSTAERAAMEARAAAVSAIQEKFQAERAASKARKLAQEALSEAENARDMALGERNVAERGGSRVSPDANPSTSVVRGLSTERQDRPPPNSISLDDGFQKVQRRWN